MQDAPFVQWYWAREKASDKKMAPASPQVLTEMLASGKAVPEFLNDRKLRDYQVESFKWMVQHALTNSHCILGDEMGLGKTAQVRFLVLFLHTVHLLLPVLARRLRQNSRSSRTPRTRLGYCSLFF